MLTPILATDYPGGMGALFAGLIWLVAWPIGSLATVLALPSSLFLRPFHPLTRVTARTAIVGTSAAVLAVLIEFGLTANDLIAEYHNPPVIHRLMVEHRTWAIMTATSLLLAWLAFGIRYRRCRDCPPDES